MGKGGAQQVSTPKETQQFRDMVTMAREGWAFAKDHTAPVDREYGKKVTEGVSSAPISAQSTSEIQKNIDNATLSGGAPRMGFVGAGGRNISRMSGDAITRGNALSSTGISANNLANTQTITNKLGYIGSKMGLQSEALQGATDMAKNSLATEIADAQNRAAMSQTWANAAMGLAGIGANIGARAYAQKKT